MRRTLLPTLLLLLSTSVFAQSVEEQIQTQIKKIDASIPVVSIEKAPIPGMYEVELGSGEVLYTDEKGEFFLLGNLYQLSDAEGFVSLTEKKQNAQREKEMAALDDSDLVIYPAQGAEKASVFVFTDVDCPYCRKLHDEVPKLQAQGVTVKYLAFPRQGPGSPVHKKMESIWCAEDRNAAMDQSKQGKSVASATCENPVIDQYMLGQKAGVTGTPAIVTAQGKLIPGYMPASRLIELIKADS
ncbi:MAG: DsbC family protein [Neptunomonas phycophila]|uniref:DsbC family protein n=1 Tax=Neptunomonas phycophila TaxID=1572645 RepID=UPI003B8B7C4A